ncbi:helix-turn-helix domain-containing protein [Tessaracoccus sp. HDW20]|uniref:PocR ligand-binding domain-containing protein n=1 Tax=Tessaracoccus coleopterorum TaxID=2714950 RepID=UPI0018D2DF65|nr:PocR ligand-binding domain-containing protein [Tessaracoccus coleopterorum]NHB84681.1 helix-turn-helix domain-containing protein [Tessaracoccus coleopterorum]
MSSLMLGTPGMGPDLRHLVDIDRLQEIQDNYAAETGLAMITVDSTGSPVTTASQFSQLCQLLRRDPKVRQLCYGCDAHGGFQSAIEGRPVIYQCHAGLVDFSVAITRGSQYLGAVMAGQVLLDRDQEQLNRMLTGSSDLPYSEEARALAKELRVVALDELHHAAEAVVKLANDTLLGRDSKLLLKASAGPYLGRRASEPRGSSTLVPEGTPPSCVDPVELVRHLHERNLAGNLDLVGDYLDQLIPRWSMKVPRERLGDLEDVLIGVATGEGVQYGRDMTVEVMSRRKGRRTSMNRYEAQVHAERLLILLHELVEPKLAMNERTISTLLNEIEKDPTAFLSVQKAASYLAWSESHFARQFKQQTKQSFISYVTTKRLDRAKLMLAHTTKPVLRIADELDFQPLNYFSRTFKKHTGQTPTEYRQHLAEVDS